MKKGYVQNVYIHNIDNFNQPAIMSKVNQFHVDLIRRTFEKLDLSSKNRLEIIENIIQLLKSREQKTIIDE